MKQVTQAEFAAYVRSLPDRAVHTPIETVNRAVMQITLDGELVAQAHYPPTCTMKNGVTEGVDYRIKSTSAT